MDRCSGPHVGYNDRKYAAVGSNHAYLFRGGTPVYIIIVLLLMLVLSALSVVKEWYFLGSDAGLFLLIGKWFVFWGVAIRLTSARARQAMNPKYTAETILGLETSEPRVVVRKLGCANIAIGTGEFASILAHQWRTPAVVAGAIFYGLAGDNHLVAKNRNRLQNVAALSDLLACSILCVYCLAVVAR